MIIWSPQTKKDSTKLKSCKSRLIGMMRGRSPDERPIPSVQAAKVGACEVAETQRQILKLCGSHGLSPQYQEGYPVKPTFVHPALLWWQPESIFSKAWAMRQKEQLHVDGITNNSRTLAPTEERVSLVRKVESTFAGGLSVAITVLHGEAAIASTLWTQAADFRPQQLSAINNRSSQLKMIHLPGSMDLQTPTFAPTLQSCLWLLELQLLPSHRTIGGFLNRSSFSPSILPMPEVWQGFWFSSPVNFACLNKEQCTYTYTQRTVVSNAPQTNFSKSHDSVLV